MLNLKAENVDVNEDSGRLKAPPNMVGIWGPRFKGLDRLLLHPK